MTAQSSAESELIALTETCKELTWLKEIFKAFDINIQEPTTVLTDSQSCISMVKNQKFSNRTKHIETRFFYVREQATEGKVILEYVSTTENIADLMTKPLTSVRTEYLRKLAGMINDTPTT